MPGAASGCECRHDAPVPRAQDNELASVRDLAFADPGALQGNPSAGKRSFLARVMATARSLTAEEQRAADPASAGSAAGSGSAPEPMCHVDIQAKLQGGALKDVGQAFWPRSAAVDALETDVKRLQRRGIRRPSVFADLKKFLPSWAESKSAKEEADEGPPMSRDLRDLSRALGVANPVKAKSLTFTQWHAAFDRCARLRAGRAPKSNGVVRARRCAIACVCTEQMSLAATIRHRQNVMKARLSPLLGGSSGASAMRARRGRWPRRRPMPIGVARWGSSTMRFAGALGQRGLAPVMIPSTSKLSWQRSM